MLTLSILLAIVAVGIALRLNELGNNGFYVDEIYSVLVASGKGDPELIAFDSIRPVYFFLLKLWMNFGGSELWLRLFSVIFGTVDIVLTYYLGKLVAGRRVGLVAATLMALSPMEVHYSQLARMYTLGSFFALSGSIAFLKAFQTGKRQFLFFWAAVRTLMVWTLPLTATLLGADIVLSVWKERKGKLMPTVIACFFAVIALYLCNAWKMPELTQKSNYDVWRYSLPVPTISSTLMMLVNYTSTALPIQECEGPKEGGLFANLYSLLVLTLLAISIIPALKQRWLIWCTVWALVPLALAFAASQPKDAASFVVTRYLMFASPFAFVMIAAGWNELWRPRKLRVLAVLAALLYALIMMFNLGDLFINPVHEDWRVISNFIQENERPGDKVIVWNYHSRYLLGYYYKGQNKVYDVIVNDVYDKDGKFKDVALDVPGLKKIDGRCWILIREAPENWASGWAAYQLVMRNLEKNYKVLSHDHLSRMDIYLVTEK